MKIEDLSDSKAKFDDVCESAFDDLVSIGKAVAKGTSVQLFSAAKGAAKGAALGAALGAVVGKKLGMNPVDAAKKAAIAGVIAGQAASIVSGESGKAAANSRLDDLEGYIDLANEDITKWKKEPKGMRRDTKIRRRKEEIKGWMSEHKTLTSKGQ